MAKASATRPRTPAASLPIARVTVDVPLPHLDRVFDYLIPAEFDDTVRAGCRVKVRFAGQYVDAYVLERVEQSEFGGRLQFLARAVSAEPVLSQELVALARNIADRYAGSLMDVLRLAIPPRHADVEAAAVTSGALPLPQAPDGTEWASYRHGPKLVAAFAQGRAPRAVWQILPGEDWAARIAELLLATLSSGRGAIAVVPDATDIARVDAAITDRVGESEAEQHVVLTASLGPKERYRRWLRVRRGQVACVVGNRAASFAPISNLGCVVIVDDGDDLHAEPRSPYPHARETLLTRAQLEGAGVVVAGYARTPEAQILIDTGWAHPVSPERAVMRERAPRVVAMTDTDQHGDGAAQHARLPTVAWRAARDALAHGTPVLIQVPRRGYLPAVACVQCRIAARCAHCAGPMSLAAASATPTCRWCGRLGADWACTACGGRRLRATVVGAGRTAEELGRAFPGVTIRTSGRDGMLSDVDDAPGLVVATPGAEPRAAGGYGAALLLDSWALLGRSDLRAGQEALRRWFAAAALVRAARHGGQVVIMADAGLAVVQALVRWDPVGFATRELADRAELSFPPAVRMASITGSSLALADFLTIARLPESAQVLGPVPIAGKEPDLEQALIRVPRRDAMPLAAALKEGASMRSARKAAESVRVVIDPQQLG